MAALPPTLLLARLAPGSPGYDRWIYYRGSVGLAPLPHGEPAVTWWMLVRNRVLGASPDGFEDEAQARTRLQGLSAAAQAGIVIAADAEALCGRPAPGLSVEILGAATARGLRFNIRDKQNRLAMIGVHRYPTAYDRNMAIRSARDCLSAGVISAGTVTQLDFPDGRGLVPAPTARR